MDRARNRILKTMDNQARVLVWELDEFLVVAGPLFLGICCGSLLVAISGVGLKPIYSRIRKRLKRGVLSSYLYWLLPSRALRRRGFFVHLPDSHERDLLL